MNEAGGRLMDYINDYTSENSVIYIDGTENEPVPGLNEIMARMAELYIDYYLDPDYLDSIPSDETIIIDYTTLSEEEMRELFKCAVTSTELEADDNSTCMLLS